MISCTTRSRIAGQPVSAGLDDQRGTREHTVHGFGAACRVGDSRMLATLLAPTAVLVVDSDGRVDAPLEPTSGIASATAHILSLLGPDSGLLASAQSVNGETALVFRRKEAVAAVACLDVIDGLIYAVWLTVNPHKLIHWNRGESVTE
jgi:hypothetical protein